jgi:hypothetical protein
MWTSGSTGTKSIKAINATGLDATGNYAVACGNSTLASGNASFAEGNNTRAISDNSHAEGYYTTASGAHSHSEGVYTLASNNSSHAEGNTTTATGNSSHAEGTLSKAFGNFSHAEGYQTTAGGNGSHAEGFTTQALNLGSHSEGSLTTASGQYSHAEGFTTTASGNRGSHAEGWETKSLNDASHAEGYLTTASGQYSHAEGYLTTASNRGSHAEGRETSASGDYSHAEGWGTVSNSFYTHAEGYYTTASGWWSHAEGTNSIALNLGSHAEGQQTTSSGVGSHSEGQQTTASGNYSHAEGFNTKATGNTSHAEGELTTAGGTTSHAEGYATTASGPASHAEGAGTEASGPNSHAEGSDTEATGNASHAEGYGSIASGPYSHAEGLYTTASGLISHAEGYDTTASGDSSHAEGADTIAEGTASHAEGKYTTASGDSSHAEGYYTVAGGFGSHSEGQQTTASGNYSHAEGYSTLASGLGSHAEGVKNIATAEGAHAEGGFYDIVKARYNSTSATTTSAHAEGYSTLASGFGSHAEGGNTIASGSLSHAEGGSTTASGEYSHAEGIFTIASGLYSHAGGQITIASGITSFVHGYNSIAGGANTVVLGTNITGTTDNTTYVDNFNINTEPPINNDLDKVLSRDSNGDIKSIELSQLKTVFSGTHATLTTIKNNNELKVGNKYILTDYQTKYVINGSDSSTRQELHTMIGAAGLYTQFNNVPSNIASNGDVVTCVFAPSGATISSGQTFTIIDYFNVAYIRFSPTVTNLANVGAIFRFEKQRYPNIPNNIVINDINGKPVIKPSGVINTEVHDDLPYMSMTGVENTSPIIESLVLTAIDLDKFSTQAESLTFLGDKLTYDFENTNILDDNGNIIGSRNGLITKRTNLNETISANADWRVQKYRRYLIDEVNWNGMLLRKNLGTNSATTASTIYNISGINYCTNTNPTLSINHRYVVPEPYVFNFYSDFAKTVPDPFISGTTTAPVLTNGQRLVVEPHSTEYSVDVSLPLSGFSGTTLAKDFNVIPLVNYEPTSLTTYFNINSMTNVVCLNNSQRYGGSGNIYIDSRNASIIDSTFMSGPTIINTKDLRNLTAIDNLSLTNYGNIYNTIFTARISIINEGRMVNNTFGNGYVGPGVNEFTIYYFSENSIVTNSIFGSNRVDTLNFNDIITNRCIIINNYTAYSSMGGKLYLTQYKSSGQIFGSDTTINSFSTQIPLKGFFGYVYNLTTPINDTQLNNFNQNKNLMYQNVDSASTISMVTVVNVQ